MSFDQADLDVLAGETAGFVTRLIAYVVDLFVVGLLIAAMLWTADRIDRALDITILDLSLELGTVALYLVPFVAAAYYVFFWSLTGATIGKWLLGLRVVSPDGSRISIARALVRLVGYVLSAVAVYVGYLWVLVDGKRRAWHDMLAQTRVVYARFDD